MADRTDQTAPPPPERLFTWVDVDEHLALLASANAWPNWLLSADSWWDSLELVVAAGAEVRQVQEWLDWAFGAGSTELRSDQLLLGLDDPRVREFTGVPVVLVEGTEGGASARRLPLLREKHITRELANPFDRPRERFAGNVEIVAFHSFKGGVGRTVHAVALADAVAQRGGNVLLVDADLEAPGITWMHRAQGGQLDFAYEDLLALLQSGEDGDCSAAVDIAAAYLPNQQVGHHPGGGRLTLIPATGGRFSPRPGSSRRTCSRRTGRATFSPRRWPHWPRARVRTPSWWICGRVLPSCPRRCCSIPGCSGSSSRR